MKRCSLHSRQELGETDPTLTTIIPDEPTSKPQTYNARLQSIFRGPPGVNARHRTSSVYAGQPANSYNLQGARRIRSTPGKRQGHLDSTAVPTKQSDNIDPNP
ncbi:hypothetical protein HPB48_013189 [Haemaphysalis longicornis]|uniref:Uncharacterized protein n=1 Tax=Haemaphysalis longicornis TaxID=44386 RepID=A0A9J6FEY0_HAELO|nr:hypothetical protein HPB48_013189 [Haemaphysalis longicornis]